MNKKQFAWIFCIEAWERFGFFVLQAMLSMLLLKHLGLDQASATNIFGAFIALAFGFAWIGGYLADRYFGYRAMTLLGAILLLLSYGFLYVASKSMVVFALGGVVMGGALFKCNPSAMLSRLSSESGQLDSLMTLYYMAINLAAILSVALAPIIALHFGWSATFLLSASALLIDVVVVSFKYADLSSLDHRPRLKHQLGKLALVCVLALLCGVIFGWLLLNIQLNLFLVVFSVLLVGYVLYRLRSSGVLAFKKALVLSILLAEAMLFFVVYNQMPTSLTFFAWYHVRHVFYGWHIPASEYQALDPIFVFIFAPLLAWLYKKRVIQNTIKYAIAMSLCGLSLWVVCLASMHAHSGQVSPLWMLLIYGLMSLSEVLIAGLGLAVVSMLSPVEHRGFAMGFWFLSLALSGPISAWMSNWTALKANAHPFSLASLQLVSHAFFNMGLLVVSLSVVVWVVNIFLTRHMNCA